MPIVKLWYGLTMRVTKLSSTRVSKFDILKDIPNSYGWGTRYKKDPLNGKLDYLTHPSRLAFNAANELPFGDCDDHAIYWCVALLKGGFASRTWFCIYQMEKKMVVLVVTLFVFTNLRMTTCTTGLIIPCRYT